jgi:MYND finger
VTAAAAAPESDVTSTATSTVSGRSTTGSTAAAAAASAATHAKHSVGAVKDNTVKPRAAPMTAAAAARAAAAVTKATATWMCMACKHIGNPIQNAACHGCGVIGNTEQQRREFEVSLPEQIARGPDIELPPDYSSRWSAKATSKTNTKSTAKTTTAKTNSRAVAAPRSVRRAAGSRSDSNLKILNITSSSATAEADYAALSSLAGVTAMYSYRVPTDTSAAADSLTAEYDRTEPVGSWRCVERDLPVCNRYLSKIAQVLASSTKERLSDSTRYHSAVPTAARYLEAELYNTADSFAVYSDDSTWQLRMCEIAESDWDSEVAVAWYAADDYCQQREQATAAVIAAAAITPTPLTCLNTELVGCSWRSDAHDMQQRSRFVNTIAQAFENTPPAFVVKLAQRLEASLYSSACSFQSYSDESTWVSRLQRAMKLDEKRELGTSSTGTSCYASARVVAATSAEPASINGSKPILVGAIAAAEAAAVAATGSAAVMSSVASATPTSCASTTATSNITCITADGNSSVLAAASTAAVAGSGTDAVAVTAAAEAGVVLQQPVTTDQQLCAINTEHIDSDRILAQSEAAVDSSVAAIAMGLTTAQLNADGDSENKTRIAAALLQQQQQQKLLAVNSHVKAAAQRAAVTAAAATAALSHVLAQQILSDTHAVLAASTAAITSTDGAGAALRAQAAAIQELHAVQLAAQQQYTDATHVARANRLGTVTSVDSDGDDDCPPIAYASALYNTAGALSDSAATLAPAATVTAVNSSLTSRTDGDTVHKQSVQQQPCAQCGKLTKKRCRRCQAVYYCSEECQVQCFEDPQHKAQCKVAAIAEATVPAAAGALTHHGA